MSCLYACAYVWAGVCGCVWLRLIHSSWESSPLGYISSCHALPLVRSLQCLRSSFTVRSGSAIPEPCCFLDSDRRTFGCPLLPCATRLCPTESSVSAYGKLRLCPTESSVSAYGKLRFCLRKAPPLPYGKLCFCLRKAPPLPTKSSTLVSRCVLLLVINSLFRNWILPSSLWHFKHDPEISNFHYTWLMFILFLNLLEFCNGQQVAKKECEEKIHLPLGKEYVCVCVCVLVWYTEKKSYIILRPK